MTTEAAKMDEMDINMRFLMLVCFIDIPLQIIFDGEEKFFSLLIYYTSGAQ